MMILFVKLKKGIGHKLSISNSSTISVNLTHKVKND
jgi:hypothetical protein